MTGRTHMTSSLLISSYLFRTNPVDLIFAPFLLFGALLPDADNRYSMIQNLLNIIYFGIAACFIILKNRNWTTVICMFLIIILSILAKKYTEHRSLTHSILGLVLFTGCMFPINRTGAMFYAIGHISHIALDSLTPRGVQLLYPLDKVVRVGKFKFSNSDDTLINFITFLLTVYFVLV